MKLLVVAFLFFITSYSGQGFGQDGYDAIANDQDVYDPDFLLEPVVQLPDEEPVPEGYLEGSYAIVSRRVIRLANKVDSVFGDKRAVDEYDGSSLRIAQEVDYSKSGFKTGDLSVSLNLKLPNLDSIGEEIRKKVWDEPIHYLNENEAPDNAEITKRQFKEENPWEFNQESGVRASIPIGYFAQLRARKNFLTAPFVHHYLMQVGWDSKLEWEQKMSLTSDFAINRDLLFRFLNEENWAMTNHEVGTIHGPSILQQINDKTALSYDARILFKWQGDNLYVDNYTVGAAYRIALASRRIFLEFKPVLSFPKETNHAMGWNIYMSFELLFGRAS